MARVKPVDCTTNPTIVLKAVDIPEYRDVVDEAGIPAAARRSRSVATRREKSDREVLFHVFLPRVRRTPRRLIADGRDTGAHSAFGRRYLTPIECSQREFPISPAAPDAEVRCAGRTRAAASTRIEAVAPCRASSKGDPDEIIEDRRPGCHRLARKVPAMMATTETLRGVLRTSRGQPILKLQSAEQRGRTGHTTDLSPQRNLWQCKRRLFLALRPPKLSRGLTEQMTEMTC